MLLMIRMIIFDIYSIELYIFTLSYCNQRLVFLVLLTTSRKHTRFINIMMHSLISSVSKIVTNYVSRITWATPHHESSSHSSARSSSIHVTRDQPASSSKSDKIEISDSEHSLSCNSQEGNNNVVPTTEFQNDDQLLLQ